MFLPIQFNLCGFFKRIYQFLCGKNTFISKFVYDYFLSLTLSSMNCVLPYSYIALLFMSQ